jgi:hypothetical protein
VAVHDELGAVRQRDALPDLLPVQLEELRYVEVTRSRDVTLPGIARIAGFARVLGRAADVEERKLLLTVDQLLELDVQETSSSSCATAGR